MGEMRGHKLLARLSRPERRALLKKEQWARKSGDWGAWEKIDLPNGMPGRGWCRDVTCAYKNRVFSVLHRPVDRGVHLSVTSLSQVRPSWYEMQRIKDEIAGEDSVAVEIYPRRKEIVDGADMFHIWVCNDALPFNLWRSEEAA